MLLDHKINIFFSICNIFLVLRDFSKKPKKKKTKTLNKKSKQLLIFVASICAL